MIIQRTILFFKAILGFFRGNGGLLINIVSGPRNLTNCGSAEWQVRWHLRNMRQTGWIIQHIKWKADVTDCSGNPRRPRNPDGLEFWEAWEVRNGRIWVGFASRGIAHRADTFRTVDEGEGTTGKITITGRVRFYRNYNLVVPPWGYTVPESGNLPTIRNRPRCWTDS
ncbi:hypothetical protein HYR99_23440 [Candidatus Poribacteria bacterium]|nr:hypothetical protein [Candidatus Poribacteria bacterium]